MLDWIARHTRQWQDAYAENARLAAAWAENEREARDLSLATFEPTPHGRFYGFIGMVGISLALWRGIVMLAAWLS